MSIVDHYFDSPSEAADYAKKFVRFFRLGYSMRQVLAQKIDNAERTELLEYAEHLSNPKEIE